MSAAPEPFPPPFRALLQRILARAAHLVGARAEAARARRRHLAQSGVFTGHRHYVAGDDPRLIDWNAYARSGALYVKQLEEEERRHATLVLDGSASMTAGTPARRLGALRLAAILGGLALRRLDGLHVVGGGIDRHFQGGPALAALLDCLAALPLAGADAPLDQAQALLRRGRPGHVLWVSDFAVPAPFQPALALLRQHGCRLTGWLPEIADDRQAPRRGWLRLHDPETGVEEVLWVDGALAAQLARELQELRRRQDLVFATAGCPLQRFPLPAPDDFAFGSWVEVGWRCRR